MKMKKIFDKFNSAGKLRLLLANTYAQTENNFNGH